MACNRACEGPEWADRDLSPPECNVRYCRPTPEKWPVGSRLYLTKIRRLSPLSCIPSQQRCSIEDIAFDDLHTALVGVPQALCTAQMERELRICLGQQHMRGVARKAAIRAEDQGCSTDRT